MWSARSTATSGGTRFLRAGREGALNVDVTLERRQGNDARVGRLRANRDGRVDAAHVGQTEVHQRHVGPMQAKLLDALLAGRGLGDNRHIRLLADDRDETGAHERMIVNRQDSNGAVSHDLVPSPV
jgi:hypothetical protein